MNDHSLTFTSRIVVPTGYGGLHERKMRIRLRQRDVDGILVRHNLAVKRRIKQSELRIDHLDLCEKLMWRKLEGSIERGGTAKAVRDVQKVLNTINVPGVTFQITGADIEQRRTTEEPAGVSPPEHRIGLGSE